MIHSPITTTILLVILTFPLVLLLHITYLRFFKTGGMRGLLYAVALYLPCWLFWVKMTLGSAFSLAANLGGVYIIGFLTLGYAECFSMICRGFSLHIVTSIYRGSSQTIADLIARYSGMGEKGLIKKRIQTLVALKMIEEKDGVLHLTMRGRFMGRLGILIKNILKLGRGG